MFTRFGVELPLPTRILIATSNFFVNYWGLLIAAIIGAFVIFSVLGGYRRWSREVRQTAFKYCLLLGSMVNRAQLSRFSRTFSLMLKSGVPLKPIISFSW